MVRITRMTKKRLGELLRDEGLVNEEQIQEALGEQRKSGELLGEVLVRLGYVTEADIAQTIVTQFGLPYIAIKQYYLSDEVIGLFPERLMRQHQFIPLDRIGNVITIAVGGGVFNTAILSELEVMTSAKIQVFVSTWSEIKTAIDEQFKNTPKAKAAAATTGAGAGADAGAGSEFTELGSMLLGHEGAEAGPEEANKFDKRMGSILVKSAP
jgi:type IV pilus assembly protein PilB